MIAEIRGVNIRALGQGDLKHGNNSGELKLVKTLEEWLVFINDGDVADFVNLMESLDSVLDQLSQVDCGLDSIGDTLDDDGVVGSIGTIKEFPCSLEISSDTNASSDSDFVGRKWIFSLIDSSVSLCHKYFLVKSVFLFKND